MSTDLQTVCPVCAKTRSAPSHHQKLFLVAERLLSDPQSTPLAAREKTEELNWKVNYKLGILDPAVEEPGIIPGGLHSQTHFYYPFESEFEMRAALKLLEKATVLSEGGWRIWLDMVDHLPVESSSASSPPSNESCREQQTQTQGRGVPPLSTAPSSSLTVPLTSSKNANISKPAIASLQEVEELDMTGDAAQSVTQIKPSNPFAGLAQPSVTSGPEFAKQRNTKIRTLQDFYQLLDLIERTSYCSARFLEAYAEFLRGDLCSECWLRHNILLGDSAEASAPHVKQASNASLSKHGLPSSRNVVGPPPLIEHSSIGGYHKHSIPSTQGPEWKRKGLLSTFRGH
ncbi:MAG: hypothetical protein M1836_005888 [Candelina mexicana]|nr:MAG: hypothetical protein M1836_005888 [Candelina mexicana]